jgi:type IX secretion system PorP/SprF family membrane protein
LEYLHILKNIIYFAQSLQLEVRGKEDVFLIKFAMFFLMLYGGCVFSQNESMFSQTSFNPAFVNPAYAGNDSSEYFNVLVMNRNQMSGLEKAPGTTVLNVNGPLAIGGIQGGITATFYSDKVGYLSTPAFNLGYAYKIELNKGSLGLGLSAGVFFSTLESESWILPDGNSDPAIPTGKESKQSLDLGLGLYYSNDRLYAGLSVTHLTRPVLVYGDNPTKTPRNYYFMAGYRFSFNNPEFELRPSILALSDLKTVLYSVNSLLFYRNKFWVGLDYRVKSSLGLLAGLNVLPELRLGYSYGYNTSLLSRFGGSNHEIMLTYRFSVHIDKGKQKYKSIRYL